MTRKPKVLVTGSAGLVGRALCATLEERGWEPIAFDRVDGRDVRDADAVARAAAEADGIVHLAAVSRVVWAERDPESARDTNEGGTRNVVAAALASPRQPFLLFASSREVYGEPELLPVSEGSPLHPLNVYAHSKVAGEEAVLGARERGLRAGVLRLSNVYGDAADHVDRVIPAFVRAALADSELRVDGREHTFDFTWLPDVIEGWMAAIEAIAGGSRLPPLHLVSGEGTTLGRLAQLAIEACGGGWIREAPPRSYDVTTFVGDPRRAAAMLGWRARTPLTEGLSRLALALRRS